MTKDKIESALFVSVIGVFYEVYNILGFGFLEITSGRLEWELRQRGHDVVREMGVIINYKHLDLGHRRIDMIVDDCLVVETKSTAILPPFTSRQIFNYLRASHLELGLLLHFGPKPYFKKIFRRPHHKPFRAFLFIPSMVEFLGAENP